MKVVEAALRKKSVRPVSGTRELCIFAVFHLQIKRYVVKIIVKHFADDGLWR